MLLIEVTAFTISTMDGDEFQYSSDDDENVIEGDQIVVKNKRGKGKEWYPIRTYYSIVDAKNSIDIENRIKGRVNRGSTIAFYYHCKFKSCGCQMKWRLVTSQYSYEVVEEQSGEHSCHEMIRRNGGRGLSFEQVEMMDTVIQLRITKPAAVILFFENVAKQILEDGKIFSRILF